MFIKKILFLIKVTLLLIVFINPLPAQENQNNIDFKKWVIENRLRIENSQKNNTTMKPGAVINAIKKNTITSPPSQQSIKKRKTINNIEKEIPKYNNKKPPKKKSINNLPAEQRLNCNTINKNSAYQCTTSIDIKKLLTNKASILKKSKINKIGGIDEKFKEILKKLVKKNQKKTIDPSPNVDTENSVTTSKTIKCHPIDKMLFTGQKKISKPSINSTINKNYAKKCIKSKDIESIITDINNFYLLKGYTTTRALLPAQDLKTKVLNIVIQEGMVEKVIQVGKGNKLNLRTIASFLEGEILNIRNIEQMLEQYNRISSNSVEMNITPGSMNGYSIIEINNKQKNNYFNTAISIDDKGSKSTGKNRLGLTFTINDTFGLNGQTIIGGRTPIPRKSDNYSYSYNISHSIPLLNTNITLSFDSSKYLNTITLFSGNKIINNGNSNNFSLSMGKLLFRDRVSKLNNTIIISTSESKNYVEDLLLTSSSKKFTKITNDLSFDSAYSFGSINASLKYILGVSLLSGYKDRYYIRKEDPHAQFSKVQLNLGYNTTAKVFNKSINLSSKLTAQNANVGLYGGDQISAGSGTIRGFNSTSFSGEKGYYVTNDVTIPFQVGKSSFSGRASFGIDFGKVKSINEQNTDNKTLYGMFTNLRLSHPIGINIDMLYGKPLKYPKDTEPDEPTFQTNISYNF